MQNQQPRKRGRPAGSKTKNRKPLRSPKQKRRTHQLEQEAALDPNLNREPNQNPPHGMTAILENSSETSSAVTGIEAVEEHTERFETIAASVPDVIGDAPAVAETVDVIDVDGIPEGEMPPEGEFVLTHSTVRFYLKFGFNLAAQLTKDAEWNLDNEELTMATPVTHDLVQKYLPWFLGKSAYKEEIAFAIVLSGIVGRRLMMRKKPMNTVGTVTPESSVSPDMAKAS